MNNLLKMNNKLYKKLYLQSIYQVYIPASALDWTMIK